MKEYLAKNENGVYELNTQGFGIEIPNGADIYLESPFGYAFYGKWNGELLMSFDTMLKNAWHQESTLVKENYQELYRTAWQREPKYKEFLNAKDNYSLVVLPEHAGDDKDSGLIEVPNFAEIYVKQKNTSHGFFAKNNGETLDTFNTTEKCGWHKESTLKLDNINIYYMIIWQRHTQPEELPFIDCDDKKHSHYFKDVSDLNEIDVYNVLQLFEVTDPCLQHIVKKALCAGKRGHKDFYTDLQNIHDTAKRALEINK